MYKRTVDEIDEIQQVLVFQRPSLILDPSALKADS